jgi:hypothetical protein
VIASIGGDKAAVSAGLFRDAGIKIGVGATRVAAKAATVGHFSSHADCWQRLYF